MTRQLTPPARLLSAVKLLVATLLLARLGGVASTIVPSVRVSLGLLILLLVGERVGYELAAHGRRATFEAWRQWAHRHSFALGLVAITVVAIALRFFALDWELGHIPPNIDENRLNASILYLFRSGEIDYRTVEHYPGIHYWMLAGTYLVAYLWGLMTDVADNLATMPVIYFVTYGRAVSALQSTATVVLVGLLGRRLVSARVGLLAAAVLGVAPLSLLVGRQLRNDSAATMLIVAAVFVALGVYRRGFKTWEALLAGTLAGLATGVKYTGVFVLLPVLLAAATSEDRPRRAHAVGLATCGFLFAALLSNHFVWADLPNFLDQLSDQILITGETHWAAQDNPAAYHALTHAQRVAGWPMFVLGAAALAYHLAAGNWRWWLFSIYPLIALWFVAQRPSQLPRWVYPEAPFMAVAAATGVVAAMSWAAQRLPAGLREKPRRTALAVLTIVALFSPLIWTDARNLSLMVSTPTWTLAEQWLDENTARGDRILLQRRWLQLDGQRYDLNRQLLADVFEGGFYELAANDWIVVHEELFAHPRLNELELVEQITVDRSFFGTQGPDFRFYRPPAIPPAAVPLQVSLTDREARRYLGHEWPGSGGAAPTLPAGGAGLYLPPLGGTGLHLDIVVQAPAADDLPPAIEARSRGNELGVVRTLGDDGTLVFTVELPLRVVGPRVVSLYLQPVAESGPVDVRALRLY